MCELTDMLKSMAKKEANQPPPEGAYQEDFLTPEDLETRLSPFLKNLSKKNGKFWNPEQGIKIGIKKEYFFYCNYGQTQFDIAKEIENGENPYCNGCCRANKSDLNKPVCIGLLLRMAYHAKERKQRH